MRTAVFLALLLLSGSTPSVSPISVANVTDSAESITVFLEIIKTSLPGIMEDFETRSNIWDSTGINNGDWSYTGGTQPLEAIPNDKDSISMLILVSKFSDVLSICNLLFSKAPQLAILGKISDILSSGVDLFTPNLHMELMNELHGIQQKLDQLHQQLYNLQDNLEASIEFQNWLTTYIDWELKIKYGADKLDEISGLMLNDGNDEESILRHKAEYVEVFLETGIEESVDKIYQLTGNHYAGPTMRNLFVLYQQDSGCDVMELTRLMGVIRFLMYSGTVQRLAYMLFTGKNDRVPALMSQFRERIYSIRERYEGVVWECMQTIKTRAETDAKDLFDRNVENVPAAMSKIYQRLSTKYTWYSWAVVAIDAESFTKIRYTFAACVDLPCHLVETPSNLVERKGNKNWEAVTIAMVDTVDTYFVITSLQDSDVNILVAWQDVNRGKIVCSELVDAKHIFFEYCKSEDACDFDPKLIAQIGNMLTKDYCGNMTDEVLIRRLTEDNFVHKSERVVTSINRFNKEPAWLAVLSDVENPCLISGACSDNGECNHIPHTSQKFCRCNAHYEGDSCEIYDSTSERVENAMSVLVDFLGQFNVLRGIPDVITLHFQLREISGFLEQMQDKLQTSLIFNRALVLYGDAFIQARYITAAYEQIGNNTRSELAFAKLKSLNVDFVLHRLKEIILGNGFSLSGDFMYLYKRAYVAEHGGHLACAEPYFKQVSNTMNKIAELDFTVTMISLLLATFDVKQAPDVIANKMVAQMKIDGEDGIARQQMYYDYWNRSSCPILETDNLVEFFCDDTSSYEGMEVELSCDNDTQPTPRTVTCVRRDGVLVWSADPVCDYEWAAWGEWGECTEVCDGGNRTRTREKPNGASDTGSEECNTESCCQKKFGWFDCGNNICINETKVCDGNMDCADGRDETNTQLCTYLRVGDTVALQNQRQGWLNCRCTVHCDQKDPRCYFKDDCPGEHIYPDDWDTCGISVKFIYLAAKDRKTGLAVLSGDTVAFQYASRSAEHNEYWLRCHGNKWCTTSYCPSQHFTNPDDWNRCLEETFRIYAAGRKPTEPIYSNDTVFLQLVKYDELWVTTEAGLNEYIKGGSGCVDKTLMHTYGPNTCASKAWLLHRRANKYVGDFANNAKVLKQNWVVVALLLTSAWLCFGQLPLHPYDMK